MSRRRSFGQTKSSSVDGSRPLSGGACSGSRVDMGFPHIGLETLQGCCDRQPALPAAVGESLRLGRGHGRIERLLFAVLHSPPETVPPSPGDAESGQHPPPPVDMLLALGDLACVVPHCAHQVRMLAGGEGNGVGDRTREVAHVLVDRLHLDRMGFEALALPDVVRHVGRRATARPRRSSIPGADADRLSPAVPKRR